MCTCVECHTSSYSRWTNYTRHYPSSDDLCHFCANASDGGGESCAVTECTQFVYDEHLDLFPDSIARQHDLVCDRSWRKQLVWSVLTGGKGIGVMIFSSMSDQ